jgi:hypothetical protein
MYINSGGLKLFFPDDGSWNAIQNSDTLQFIDSVQIWEKQLHMEKCQHEITSMWLLSEADWEMTDIFYTENYANLVKIKEVTL